MSGIRFLVAIIALAVVGCTTASLAFVEVNWFKVTVSSNTTSTSFNTGVIKSCNPAGVCDFNNYKSVDLGSCSRSSDLIQARFYSVLVSACWGGLLSLFAVAASVPDTKGAALSRTVLLAFSFLLIGVSAGLFYMSIERWLYCDKSYCEFVTLSSGSSCKSEFTLQYWLLAGSCPGALLGLIVAVAAYVTTPAAGSDSTTNQNDASREPTAPTPAPVPTDSTPAPHEEPEPDAKVEDEYAPEGEAEDGDEGDWVWDEESGMYWSDSAYLYLDAESGWFYDPSGWWYDPESGEWVDAGLGDAEEA